LDESVQLVVTNSPRVNLGLCDSTIMELYIGHSGILDVGGADVKNTGSIRSTEATDREHQCSQSNNHRTRWDQSLHSNPP
jgi:hypothetical protein